MMSNYLTKSRLQQTQNCNEINCLVYDTDKLNHSIQLAVGAVDASEFQSHPMPD